ncbi:M28 family peptidase [Candidatus Poribacteria bacterium]|nr:M28 family peptidase [Candidatus Poribacteria bacterium]
MSLRISGKELLTEVEQIVAIGHRRTGSAEEQRALEYLSGRFREIGLGEVSIEWFDIHYWEPQHVELKVLPEATAIRSKPVWYSGATPGGGLRAECAYAGYGMPHQFGDTRGKIAVMDGRTLLRFWPTYRFFNSYQSAVNAGALALIVITDTPCDLIPIFTAEEEKFDNPIPAILINRTEGARLKERMRASRTEVNLILEARATMSRTGDVTGLLPGRTDEYIIAGAHHDSIYGGAIDNAAGVCALLAIAKEFAGRRQPPQKNLLFVTHPGHELLIGAREFIKKHSHILNKTAAYITLDGIGCDNYEEIGGKIVKTGHDELRGIFASPNHALTNIILPIVKKYRLQPSAFLPADIMCPNEDLEGRFLEAGVPVIDIIGKPVWYHTEEDTPDKCTPDQLERGTLAQMEIIEQLDTLSLADISAAGSKGFDPISLIERKAYQTRPGIEFAYLPDKPKAGEPALIYVRHLDDLEGILVDMKWEINGEEGVKGPVLPHVFDKPGRYRVRITVTNTLGAQGTCEKNIEVA